MRVHVFDIDSTLADNSHRAKLADMRRGFKYTDEQWAIFLRPELVSTDVPYPQAQKLLKRLVGSMDCIVFVTGRREDSRVETEAWLKLHMYAGDHHHLYMRNPEENHLPAVVYKEQIFMSHIHRNADYDYNGDAEYIFYEDEPKIQEMYSKYGTVIKCPEYWSTLDKQKDERQLSFAY